MNKKSISLLLFAFLMSSCNGTGNLFSSKAESGQSDSYSSSSQKDSYSPYADYIYFGKPIYEKNEEFCIAGGSYVDPSIQEITVPEKSLSGKIVSEIIGFDKLKYLEKINLPKTLKYISFDTFSYDCSLKEIELPDSLVSIGESAFYMCSGLSNVKLPESLTMFEEYAFYGCESLDKIVIPSKVKELPCRVFGYCSNLSDVYLPQGLEKIDKFAFSATAIKKIFIPKSVKYLYSLSFSERMSEPITLYVEADSMPETWQFDKNNPDFKFIYGAKRQDVNLDD